MCPNISQVHYCITKQQQHDVEYNQMSDKPMTFVEKFAMRPLKISSFANFSSLIFAQKQSFSKFRTFICN